MVQGDFTLLNINHHINTLEINVSGIICFESVFSGLTRKNSRMGSDISFILSNDVYFKNSLLAGLHYYFSVFRAIETGRPVVRVTSMELPAL